LTIAAVSSLGRLVLIFIRQAFFPIDVVFFEVAIGIDGRK